MNKKYCLLRDISRNVLLDIVKFKLLNNLI